MVSPAARTIEYFQRNRILAQELMITRTGNAITNPAPRTINPNKIIDAVIRRSPLNAKVPKGLPGLMNERMREKTPITIKRQPRIVGK